MSGTRTGNYGLAQGYAALVGIVLVAVGLLGFIDNPIVYSDADALFRANAIHNIVHIATGAIALYIAFGLSGEAQANALIGFGVLYAAVLILTLISPTLFGLFNDAPVNAADHALHAALTIVSIAVGYRAKQGSGRTLA